MTDDEAIHRLLAARTSALLAGDADALERLLHHEYVYTDSLGRVLSREAYLQSRRRGEVTFRSQRVSDVAVTRLSRGVILVTARTDDEAAFRGEPFSASYRVSHLCVRVGEGWLFRCGQSTTIDAP